MKLKGVMRFLLLLPVLFLDVGGRILVEREH